METFERILVPVDFYPASLRALDMAITIATKFGSAIVLLHVCGWAGAPYLEKVPWSLDEVRVLATKAMGDLVRETRSRYERIDGGVIGGEPWQAIVGYVEEHDIQLVVTGTHGRGRLSRLWLGSVAERVVRASPAPVLVVPAAER